MQSSRELRHRIGVAVALTALVATAFAARSDAAPSSASTISVLRVGINSSFANVDYFRTSASTTATSLALETLMKLGPNGAPVPHLARSVKHPNPFLYVYTLRRGVKFWDGRELTAADAANALNYYRFRGSLAAYNFTSVSVREIKATGRYTLRVVLKQPSGAWPYAVAGYATGIFEKKFGDDHKGEMGRPGILTMGTGPWKIDSLDPTRGVELSANTKYWGGKVAIPRISIKFFSDETNMALAFRAGDLDVAFPNSPAAFTSASGATLTTGTGLSLGLFAMNAGAPPWNDVHLRRAVAYALNRSDVIAALGGFAKPAQTLIPAELLRSLGSRAEVNRLLKALPQYPFNLAKARAEMARSAYPSGVDVALNVRSTGTNPATAQVVAAQLKAIGINARLDVQPTGAWLAETTGPAEKRRAQVTVAGGLAPDPGVAFGYILGSKNARQGGFNLANYTPSAVDTLLDVGLRTANPKKRLATYGRLLKQLGTDVPYVPLWLSQRVVALSSAVAWPTFGSSVNHFFHGPWALAIRERG